MGFRFLPSRRPPSGIFLSPEWLRSAHRIAPRLPAKGLPRLTLNLVVHDAPGHEGSAKLNFRFTGRNTARWSEGLRRKPDLLIELNYELASRVRMTGESAAYERALFDGSMVVAGYVEALGPLVYWHFFDEVPALQPSRELVT